MTIYDQIDANRRSTWFLMVLFVVFVAAVVELIALAIGGGYTAGIIVLIFAGIFVTISYYSSSSMVLGISQAREVKRDENPDLYNVVENLCIGSGMPVPKIYIINDTAPNAFATGRDPQHATIAVTSGLLQKLDKLELEGVIAHELSHIKNYDIRLMTLVVVLVGLVALLADFMLRFTFFGSGRRPSNRGRGEGLGGALILIIALVAAILAPIAAQFIKLAISRGREYLADASGALLTRYPEGLARALEIISADKEPLEVANKATEHLYITNPLKGHKSWANNLFSTHPPIEERIRRLRAM
ncbi:MAG: zinc metalloprotease HtpX [Dehalococcoidia bacterium]|nr:zinc metalloprotease HtpX [Dehalococcoidia bacterium]